MEGVIDAEMREVFTAVGGYDRCVTEFVRVTQQNIPDHVFFKYAPELKNGGLTRAGVPVYVQLLGGDAEAMGANAARLAKLEPKGIDLNFGCPSKTVNRREGGSVLLREPERVGQIVAAVRDAVDPSIPVTAKIRLGFSHTDDLERIVEEVSVAGASELCVHARTKENGYKPPAFWHELARVSEFTRSVNLPLIVNGDVWCTQSAQQALEQSGAQHIMLGRGALRTPDLARQIKANMADQAVDCLSWTQVLDKLIIYLRNTTNLHPMFVGNRAKQWLGFLQVTYPEAKDAFMTIKRLKEANAVLAALQCLMDDAA